MASDPPPDFEHRLREADSEELLELVQRHADALRPTTVRGLLRNAYVTPEILEILVGQKRLLTSYEVRRDIAMHPRTPQIHALRLVRGLFWRDLVRLSRETRVKPVVRRAADRHLSDRVGGLATGEKMAIARQAGSGILAMLRHDPNPRVIDAMLENPRLTEGILAPTVSSEKTPPSVLKVIARNRMWGRRYGIRVALSRNPRTPTEVALSLLSGLKEPDLRAVANDVRLAQAVRKRARLLLGGD